MVRKERGFEMWWADGMRSGRIGKEDVERRGEPNGICGKAEGVTGDPSGFVGAEEKHEGETECADV